MDEHTSPNTSSDFSQRLARNWFHYVIVIPTLLFIFIFKIVPFMVGIQLSFIDYSIFRGLAGSDWVGWHNFRQALELPQLLSIFTNTLFLKYAFMAVSSVIAFILAMALSHIHAHRLRNGLAFLFLLPYFIPSVVMAYIVQLFFSTGGWISFSTHPLVQGDSFRLLVVMSEAVMVCGIPAILALAAIHAAKAKKPSASAIIPALKVIAAFLLIQLSTQLTTDFELLNSLLNPFVYHAGDTLATYQYRTGLINVQISISAVFSMIQFTIQLVLTIIAYFLLRQFFGDDLFTGQDHRKTNTAPSATTDTIGIPGLAAALPYAIFVLGLLFYLFILPFASSSASGLSAFDVLGSSTFINYILINIAVVVVYLLTTVTLAYPLTSRDLPGRTLYAIFLLFIMVIGTGTIQEYVFFRSLNLVNTVFPHMIYGFFSIISVFVLKGIFNSRHAHQKAQLRAEGKSEAELFFTLFIPKLWKPLIGLGVLHFTALWNSYYSTLAYHTNPELYSPIMTFRSASMMAIQEIPAGDPLIMQIGAIVALVPIILVLVFHRFLTAETFISQLRR